MGKKPYKLGLLVGRFQMLHLGHEDMINKALYLCDRVTVFIGSSQEFGTAKNPFSYETRKMMLRAVYGDKIEIYPLPDIGVGNNSKWGEYVLKTVFEELGRYPDVFISGKESRRTDWFDSEAGQGIAELYVSKTVDISASEMRKSIINGDVAYWREYTSPELWSFYEKLRVTVLDSRFNDKTMSI